MGPARPAASAALQDRLLPLVCQDILLVCTGQLRPKVGWLVLSMELRLPCASSTNQPAADALQAGELPYLAGWAAHPADIGLRLPEQQLEALCSYVGQHGRQLSKGDRKKLQRAFQAWGYQPGLALLA